MATPPEAMNPTAGQVAINGHRFALWRQVGDQERLIHWVILNPSTASASSDDPTMSRVWDYSRRWSFGWVTVGNLYSYRATKPAKRREWLRRGGEWVTRTTADSDRWVLSMARRADVVVVAWGNHGKLNGRGRAMLKLLAEHDIELHALAFTKAGAPAHPLRQDAKLEARPLADLRGES